MRAEKENDRAWRGAVDIDCSDQCSAASLIEPSQEAKARQRAVLLDALRRGPVSTLQAREELGVMHPAARVFELRKRGHHILTVRAVEADVFGNVHPVARYLLVGSSGSGGAA